MIAKSVWLATAEMPRFEPAAAIARIADRIDALGIDCEMTRAASYAYTTDPALREFLEREAAVAGPRDPAFNE